MDIKKGQILEEISKQLDISPTMYKLAVSRYTSVAEYLQRNGLSANFYPQGSFRLGTVVRPLRNGNDCDYDIDLVCQIDIAKGNVTPLAVKNMVGNLLKQNTVYNDILDDEGRRCWTLLYSEQNGVGFHLDILPSVSEGNDIIRELIDRYKVNHKYALSAIAITDKQKGTYSWASSNPRGYADWFDEINKPFYELVEKSARAQIFEGNRHIFASIDDVPPQLVRTPVQRVIQLLKRHRDIRFNGLEFEEDKPISMIITTLVASIVKNEYCFTSDTFTLLNFIINKLDEYAELINNSNAKVAQYQNAVIKREVATNRWYIPNPVNPTENFADRWHENDNRKAKAFFNWIKMVYNDLIAIMNNPSFDIDSIKSNFGDSIVEKAYSNYKNQYTMSTNTNAKQPSITITSPGKPWRV